MLLQGLNLNQRFSFLRKGPVCDQLRFVQTIPFQNEATRPSRKLSFNAPVLKVYYRFILAILGVKVHWWMVVIVYCNYDARYLLISGKAFP